MPSLFTNLSPGEGKSLKGLCSGVFILKKEFLQKEINQYHVKHIDSQLTIKLFHHDTPVINHDTFINNHVITDVIK